MIFEKNSLGDFLAMYEALRKYPAPFKGCSDSVWEAFDAPEDVDVERFNRMRDLITSSIQKAPEWAGLGEGIWWKFAQELSLNGFEILWRRGHFSWRKITLPG